MPKDKKRKNPKMQPGAMCAEHKIIDSLISGESPKLDELSGRGFESLKAAKKRRYRLKTAIQAELLSKDPNPDALMYALQRKWVSADAHPMVEPAG